MKTSLLGIAFTTAVGVVAFFSVANAGFTRNAGFNGLSMNGMSLQGIAPQDIQVEGGQVVAVKRVVVK